MAQINQLPDANRYLQSTDWLAIDDANGVAKKVSGDRIGISPYVATITAGQWSGSGNDYYITVNASNVTADSILIPHYDSASVANLTGPVWCVPAAGSFTIHTSALPTGTVSILVQFVGVMGEAQYQVLADVYSTSQAVAKADIVNTLTSTSTTAPLSAAQGKALNDKFNLSVAAITAASGVTSNLFARKTDSSNSVVTINGYATFATAPTASAEIGTIESGARPASSIRSVCGLATQAYNAPTAVGYITVGSGGVISVTPPSNNTSKVVYFSVSYHAQN